jgi:hypothetical protein
VLGPLVLSIVPYLISYCFASTGMCAMRNKTPFRKGLKTALLQGLPSFIFISFCLFQSASSSTFSAWDCTEFSLDSTTNPQKRQFLREDLSIECGSDEHRQVQQIAHIFFAIWPVGVPCIYLALLWQCRKALTSSKRSTDLSRRLSFLHEEYRSHFFWWEVRLPTEHGTLFAVLSWSLVRRVVAQPLFMVQRLMAVGFVMIWVPRPEDASLRIICGISITLIYMVMLLVFQPYMRKDLNYLAAIGAQFSLAFSMLVSLYLRIFNDIAARTPLALRTEGLIAVPLLSPVFESWLAVYDVKGAQKILRIDSPSQVCIPNRRGNAESCHQ